MRLPTARTRVADASAVGGPAGGSDDADDGELPDEFLDDDERLARAARRAGWLIRPTTTWSVARFIRFYGAAAYCNPAYPTRDRKVPVGLYDVLMAELDAVESAEGLRAANAAAHGQAMAEAGKDAGVQRWTRAIHARAFPTVAVPLTPAAARGQSPLPGGDDDGPLNFAPPPGLQADPGAPSPL